MNIFEETDRGRIEAFLRGNPFLHLYEIGDLDEFFWPFTTWYSWRDRDEIKALVLLYKTGIGHTLLAFAEEPMIPMKDFLSQLFPKFPERFYCHLSMGLSEALQQRFLLQFHGSHDKMGLVDPARLEKTDTRGAMPLGRTDLDAVMSLYGQSYPGNWFDPKMLDTGYYFGWRQDGRLVCIAGVHVVSETYQVAALGNVTTHPEFRGKGLGAKVCGALCKELLKSVRHIGLNVKSDNIPARKCYEKLGFAFVSSYEEYWVCKKPEDTGP